jgi:hypothetical protein
MLPDLGRRDAAIPILSLRNQAATKVRTKGLPISPVAPATRTLMNLLHSVGQFNLRTCLLARMART